MSYYRCAGVALAASGLSVGVSHLQIDTVVIRLALRVLQIQNDAFLWLEDVLNSDACGGVDVGAVRTVIASSIDARHAQEKRGSPLLCKPVSFFGFNMRHVLAVELSDLIAAKHDRRARCSWCVVRQYVHLAQRKYVAFAMLH